MIGERRNMSGRRVLCRDRDEAVWAVPVEWTDQVSLGFEYELSAGRAFFLAGDLIALSDLVAGFEQREDNPNV